MDHAKDAVAIGDRPADDAKAVDVRQTREGEVLFLHLAPDRIGFFRAAIDIGLDLHLFQLEADIGGDLVHHIARFALQGDEAADDRVARIRVQDAEGEVFQLFAHPLHAHAAGKGGEDFHGFAGFLRLLFRLHRLDRAHVVQTVGQFHQDHAQVLGHGHEQLAEVFGLLALRR